MRFPALFASTLAAVCAQVPVTIQPGAVQVQGGVPAPLQRTGPKLPADQRVATVNDEKLTVARLRQFLAGAPEQALQAAARDPGEFLTWKYMMDYLGQSAVTEGLDKKSPYADRLNWKNNEILSLGLMEYRLREARFSEQDTQAWYRDHAHEFATAKVKLIFVAAEEGKQAAAKAKAEGVVKQLRAGADFAKLARQVSDHPASAAKGGEFPDVKIDSRLPVDIRRAIYRLKPGAITAPIEQPAGFYIFQLVSTDLKPFGDMRGIVLDQMKQEAQRNWLDGIRKQVTAKVVHRQFFDSLMAAEANIKSTVSEEIKPETVLAQINGAPLTAQEYTGLMKGIPPNVRQNAVVQPDAFLQQYALMTRLTKEALAAGLDKKQPYDGRMSYNRGEILMQAYVDHTMDHISIPPDEQKKAYDANPGRFRTAKAGVLYISYSVSPPPQTDPKAPKILNEDQARAKADSIAKQIREGADFVELVRKHSEDMASREKDGDIGIISAADARVPENIRNLIFAAKSDELLGPVKLPNGFYLIRVGELNQKKYEEVKDQIYDELRQERFQKWFDGVRARFQVRIEDPAAFRAVLQE